MDATLTLPPQFLRNLGYEVIPLFCEKDGSFPYRSPNPSKKDNLIVLSHKIREERADSGIAFDGDGDRVVFADEKGKILKGEEGIIFSFETLCLTFPERKICL